MPDFGQCGEPTCPQTSARLFDCAHHCMKLVCLHHLIEHDRIFERNKKQVESHQLELKRLHSIYSTLIDESKIRSEYEQKITDYRKLVSEVTCVLENNLNDADQLRLLIDKLKKMINDKQKQADDSLTIVKVEPIDESVSSTTNTPNIPLSKNPNQNIVEDASVYIGFDRLQNLVIDTDYHRRKASEAAAAAAAAAAAVRHKIESKPIKEDDDEDDDRERSPDPPHPRIAGTCPLWLNGAYGLSETHHSVRLCRKKHYSDLSNHIRQFHGLFTPVANVIARAVQVRIPTTKCFIPNDLQVADSRRSFLCPLRSECGNQCWLPAICLKSHLMDVHRMNASTADLKIKTIRKLNRNKPMLKIRSKITEIAEQIESARK